MLFNNSINMLKTEDIIKIYLDEFNTSSKRKMMLKGEQYYKVENDIMSRKMIRYIDDQPTEDLIKTNNKLAHGFMKNLIDDKVNYLLSKPYTLSCNNEAYLDKVQEVLGKRFQRNLSKLGTEASNKGVAWLHCYINEAGQLKTVKIPSEQIIPLWTDEEHEELQAVIRYYVVENYFGSVKKDITHIEYWTSDRVDYYILKDGRVILDSERYLNNSELGHFEVNGQQASWGKVPFIAFKNNDFELPDLQFVKTLIDEYDASRSDISNLLTDIQNTIYSLKGYGGESLSEFMKDLAFYRAVKLEEDGSLDTVESNINIEASARHFEQLKKDIFDFGQGVDKNSDKLGNSPSGIALKFIYSGLDLKCNAMEENFKWSFDELLFFVNQYLGITKQGYSEEEVEIVFNRDIAINESQAITDCQNSMGIISKKTIVANHPFVTDLDEELKQIEEEELTNEPDLFMNEGEPDEEQQQE